MRCIESMNEPGTITGEFLVQCEGIIDEKGRCPNAENHIIYNKEKPAIRGKLTKDDSKAGDTWLREARNNLQRALYYMDKAAGLYENCERQGDAAECREFISSVKENQVYLRYIDRH